MMDKGYVKLWRKSINSSIFKNPKIWLFWTYCLMKATHKEYNTLEGFQEIVLKPGQFIFGRKKASEETFLSEQNIRTCLAFLKKSKNLTIKSTNKFSIISIVNWDTYQPLKDETNQHSNQQLTSNQPATNQQLTTYKNNKNNKNNKNLTTLPKKQRKQKKIFVPPSIEDVITFFHQNSYNIEIAKKAFHYYQDADWHDASGKPVLNWKQKIRGNWFKQENKYNQKFVPIYNSRLDHNKQECRKFIEGAGNEE